MSAVWRTIPADLREQPQWVLWRLETRAGKPTKIPVRADGRPASTTDPSTWTTFEDALAAAPRFAGLGFVFTPDDGLAGVDLDRCRDPETGSLSSDAGAVVLALDSYTESSPSGTGVHVIVRAALNGGRRRAGRVEMYDRGRFFCMTGEHVRGTPLTIEGRQAELDAVRRHLGLDAVPAPPPTPRPVDASDAELLERARAARNGAAFAALWRGDTSGHSSHSESDLALAGALAFWTGGDAARIDSLFRRSGLFRPKWDTRRGDSTYGALTIERALSGRSEFFTPARGFDAPDAARAPQPSPAPEQSAPTGSEAAPGDDPAPDPPTFALEVLTAREICRLPDPSKDDRLLGPLIVRRYRTVVGGATGHGKSELMLQMLRALTTGGEFLGWKGCGGHRALVLDLEQGLGSVQVKLRRAGLGDSELIDYCRVPDGLALNRDRAHIEAVEAVLARGYDVVVLDPHYKAHQGDANSERETVDLMRLLDAWRERYGFALLLPTHTRKPAEPGAKLTIHDLFGSSAFVRGAELVLGIQLVHPGYSRLHFFKDRDGVDELPVGGDAWGLLFDHEHGFRRDPNETAPPRDLEQELRELGSDCAWRTLKEWLAPKVEGGIGANEKEVRAALGRLVEAGEFEYAVGPPPRSRTAKCWRRRGATEGSWHPVAPHPSEAVPEAGATACLTPVGGVAGRSTCRPPATRAS